MDLSIYFDSLDLENITGGEILAGTYAEQIMANDGNTFPNYRQANVAIVGIKEDRCARANQGCSESPDRVRKFFYQLYAPEGEVQVADLGNILPGNTIEDTYFAVRSVVAELVKCQVIPILIGGSQDLTYANYSAYEALEQTVNIVSVDPAFDLGDVEEPLTSGSYLGKIILHKPNFLFNYSNIGYQTYFVNPRMLDLMSKMHFDVYRLGEIQSDIREAEPIVRDADILSFDFGAVRQSDAPGNALATPNGLYGEEACAIFRYAGMSDKLSSVGLYELNPLCDRNGQTAHLAAQMVWYFLDGVASRKKDFPIGDKKDYLKYRVAMPASDHELIFYKSDKTDRWWMEIPYPPDGQMRFERHHMVPCSYADYQIACKEEMPDKWWKTFNKLS